MTSAVLGEGGALDGLRMYATGASVGSRKGSKQVKTEEEEGAHCPVVAS